ncbi:MAG: hypothetical protein V4607_01955 [Pseudomonadota bacterium]
MSLVRRFLFNRRQRAMYRMAVDRPTSNPQNIALAPKPVVYCDRNIEVKADSVLTRLRLVGGL